MEYQKIVNLLDNAHNEPSKSRTRNWVEMSDELWGMYNKNKDMIRSNLCDYINAYVIVSGTITITVSGDHDAAKWADGRNKGVIFKNCVVFTDCISNIKNTQMDNPKDIDFLIPLYDLIEYSDNYSKSAGSLWQYYIDEPSDQ